MSVFQEIFIKLIFWVPFYGYSSPFLRLKVHYHKQFGFYRQAASTFARCRSSRPEVFCKKSVLRNFTKFTGKHLRQSSFF